MTDDARDIDCEEALRRLWDYVDGELDGPPRREMERHLERCRSCFSRVEFEERLKARAAELGREPVSQELEVRIQRIVDRFDG